MNAIFYHNEQQRQMGLETKAAIEKKDGRLVNTQVLPLRAFYRAEDYHQKYMLNRNSDLAKEERYDKEFVNSCTVDFEKVKASMTYWVRKQLNTKHAPSGSTRLPLMKRNPLYCKRWQTLLD